MMSSLPRKIVTQSDDDVLIIGQCIFVTTRRLAPLTIWLRFRPLQAPSPSQGGGRVRPPWVRVG